MAEERILIQKIEPECKFREKNTDTIAGEKRVWFKCCKFNKRTTCEEDDFIHCEKKELIGLSRQDAIERMAKALIRADYPHAQEVIWDMRWKEEASKDYYLIMAEAALNALLEVEE